MLNSCIKMKFEKALIRMRSNADDRALYHCEAESQGETKAAPRYGMRLHMPQ